MGCDVVSVHASRASCVWIGQHCLCCTVRSWWCCWWWCGGWGGSGVKEENGEEEEEDGVGDEDGKREWVERIVEGWVGGGGGPWICVWLLLRVSDYRFNLMWFLWVTDSVPYIISPVPSSSFFYFYFYLFLFLFFYLWGWCQSTRLSSSVVIFSSVDALIIVIIINSQVLCIEFISRYNKLRFLVTMHLIEYSASIAANCRTSLVFYFPCLSDGLSSQQQLIFDISIFV